MKFILSLGDDTLSVCGSVYDEYYDYDFIYSGSGNNSISGNTGVSEPIYASLNASLSKLIAESSPHSPSPPIPPRARMSTIDRNLSKKLKVSKDNNNFKLHWINLN